MEKSVNLSNPLFQKVRYFYVLQDINGNKAMAYPIYDTPKANDTYRNGHFLGRNGIQSFIVFHTYASKNLTVFDLDKILGITPCQFE